MNPTYVSSQFCQVTGRRFADVITEIRIEHALRLLSEDPCLKNGQLAEVSGFFSTTYFCETFKKCVGRTVRQYVKEVCAR
jgi:two-component system response regulator YesN